MLKRYGILAAAVALIGAMAAARLLREDPPPAPPEAPARSVVETPPTTTVTPPPRTTLTPPRNGKTPAVRTSEPVRFDPTPRLEELLALEAILRGEIIADLSRHIEKEGESLAAEGLLVPLQGLLDQLLAERALREAIDWLAGNHGSVGRDALMSHLDHQVRHVRARAVTGVDPKEIEKDQVKLNQLQELRTELERSLLGP